MRILTDTLSEDILPVSGQAGAFEASDLVKAAGLAWACLGSSGVESLLALVDICR